MSHPETGGSIVILLAMLTYPVYHPNYANFPCTFLLKEKYQKFKTENEFTENK
ncbi:MAG: hypothetical protein Q8903_03915 [Bacteroidota bacterium]|nr:hypothetical protein [Bacteroidota bacterium]